MATRIDGADNFDTGTSIPNFIEGLVWQNDTVDATNDFIVSAGKCRNGSLQPILTTAQTKRMDASWSSGNNGGALAAGATAFSSTGQTYHIFAMQVGGVDEIGVDSDVTGANLVANHAATIVRRIGSMPPILNASTVPVCTNTELVGGAINVEHNDVRGFDYVSVVSTTARQLIAVRAPLGIRVIANVLFQFSYSGGFAYAWMRSTDAVDQVADSTGHDIRAGAGGIEYSSTSKPVTINGNAQVAYRAQLTGATAYLQVQSFIDPRSI